MLEMQKNFHSIVVIDALMAYKDGFHSVQWNPIGAGEKQ